MGGSTVPRTLRHLMRHHVVYFILGVPAAITGFSPREGIIKLSDISQVGLLVLRVCRRQRSKALSMPG